MSLLNMQYKVMPKMQKKTPMSYIIILFSGMHITGHTDVPCMYSILAETNAVQCQSIFIF